MTTSPKSTMTMNPSECRQIVAKLWPHLDGVLPEHERERIIKHLETCSACRSHFDFALAFVDAVHAARRSSVQDDALRSRVLAALGKEGFSAS